MRHRAILALAAALAGVLLTPQGAAAMPLPHPDEFGTQVQLASCNPAGPTPADVTAAAALNQRLQATLAGHMTAYRVSCARKVVQTVRSRGLARRAAVIAITTTIPESTIQNIAEEIDHDSLGLFQQRASWGSRSQRLDPVWATNAFLNAMLAEYPNNTWLTAPIGEVCQEVQESGHPSRYQPQAGDAQIIVDLLWPQPWTSVVRADLDGNGNDELGFYRASDGLLAWYPMTSTGQLGTRLSADQVARDWTEVLGADLDGNSRDELIFYRKGTGRFEVYRATTSGQLGTRLTGVNVWGGADVLASLDTDGDRDDELALYSASTGLYAVYEMTSTGGLGTRRARVTLGTGWREIIGINVNASADDEIAFYNSAGTFAVYRTTASGTLGSRLSISTLAKGWTELAALELTGAGTDEIAFYQSVHGTFPIYRTTTSGKPGTRISLLDLAP